jgi:cytochrome c-type biogenesis protein CcmH/NrfF
VKLMNILLLLWAVVPVIVVIVGAWFFLRAGSRWERRQRGR